MLVLEGSSLDITLMQLHPGDRRHDQVRRLANREGCEISRSVTIAVALQSRPPLAGVGLMAYGNTVGSKLPSVVPVAWNAFLAGQGVSQAARKGPKNSRGKVYVRIVLVLTQNHGALE